MKPQPHSKNQAAGHSGHPTPKTFVTIGIVLAIVTGIEWAIIYVTGISTLVTTILFALSIVKFFMVAGIFMHLKFENKYLTWMFAVGVILAVLITLAVRSIIWFDPTTVH